MRRSAVGLLFRVGSRRGPVQVDDGRAGRNQSAAHQLVDPAARPVDLATGHLILDHGDDRTARCAGGCYEPRGAAEAGPELLDEVHNFHSSPLNCFDGTAHTISILLSRPDSAKQNAHKVFKLNGVVRRGARRFGTAVVGDGRLYRLFAGDRLRRLRLSRFGYGLGVCWVMVDWHKSSHSWFDVRRLWSVQMNDLRWFRECCFRQ